MCDQAARSSNGPQQTRRSRGCGPHALCGWNTGVEVVQLAKFAPMGTSSRYTQATAPQDTPADSTNHHACRPTYKACLVRHHDVGDPLRPPPGTCFAAEAALRETWRQNHPDTEAANECGPPMLKHTAHNEVHHGRCGIMNCEAAARYSFVWPCLQGYGPAGQPFWSAESPGHGYKEGANPRQHVALP